MKTQTNTLRGSITSSILALTLAFGLLPAQGIAFAAEAAESQINEDAPLVEDAAGDAEQAPAEASEADTGADAAASDVAPEPDPAAADGAPADAAASRPQYTTSNQGHTAAMLPLQTEAKPAAGDIEYGGLSYTIDPENPDTAQVTGLATDKPKGDVQVQTQVASNGKVYKVTAVRILRGGVHR